MNRLEKMSKEFIKRWVLSQTRGAALTEFAIISLLLVPLLLYGIYFFDLARINIKAQEISRFALWELTAYPLSQYQAGQSPQAGHSNLFDLAQDNVAREVRRRYADDLDSSTLAEVDQQADIQLLSGTARFTDLDITNLDVNLGDLEFDLNLSDVKNLWAEMLLQLLGNNFEQILQNWGFNTRGRAQVELGIQFSNELIPHEFAQNFFDQRLFSEQIATLNFRSRMTMIVDSWTLFDGNDIYPPGGHQKGHDDAYLLSQVDRLTWLGFGNALPFLGELNQVFDAIDQFLNVLNVDNPFQTRVASISSNGVVSEANLITLEVDTGQSRFHTSPTRDDGQDEKSSEYGKTYEARGDYYLGNQEAQKDCGQ